MTLYLKLGGRDAVVRAMPRLQARLEQDPCFDATQFRTEFERSDDLMEFLIFLSGGAPFYDGKSICNLLAPICTCHDVYERFVDHLVMVFFAGRRNKTDEAELRHLMETLRPQVLDPKPIDPIMVYSVEQELISA